MLILRSKPGFDEFTKTFTPLYKIPSLEAEFSKRVDNIARALLEFQHSSEADPLQTLVSFLRADDDFLSVVLSLTNLSQEKFKRILSAERFAKGDYDLEWDVERILREIKQKNEYAERIAALFLEGRDNTTLAQQVADFYLAQIELPNDWQAIIRDERVAKNLIRRKLTGQYNGAKGKAVENIVQAELVKLENIYGVTFAHGQVQMVQKEVDFAMPTLNDAYVMVMISYMETTGSGQTARANEQNKMYQQVISHNVRYPKDRRVLVNVMDGGGWLARRSDMRKMHAGCDYVLTLKTLDQLEPIICEHVPQRFFTKAKRPKVTMQ